MADRIILEEISYYEGQFFDVYIENGLVCINTSGSSEPEYVEMSREEAIAAARAILKHFDAMPGPVGKEEW